MTWPRYVPSLGPWIYPENGVEWILGVIACLKGYIQRMIGTKQKSNSSFLCPFPLYCSRSQRDWVMDCCLDF